MSNLSNVKIASDPKWESIYAIEEQYTNYKPFLIESRDTVGVKDSRLASDRSSLNSVVLLLPYKDGSSRIFDQVVISGTSEIEFVVLGEVNNLSNRHGLKLNHKTGPDQVILFQNSLELCMVNGIYVLRSVLDNQGTGKFNQYDITPISSTYKDIVKKVMQDKVSHYTNEAFKALKNIELYSKCV